MVVEHAVVVAGAVAGAVSGAMARAVAVAVALLVAKQFLDTVDPPPLLEQWLQ